MDLKALTAFLVAHQADLIARTMQHLELVALALLAATLFGLPLAVLLRGHRPATSAFLGFAGIVQTVPSLALLSVMLPLFGLGRSSAVAALFLYALLPVIRNTLVGLDGVDPAVADAARGMGLNGAQLFWSVQFPLALPTIFAGLRTAAVISVGIATLSALVGAGGLGVFIFRGVATNQPALIFLGAVPAALLALGIDGALGLVQQHLLRRPRRVAVAGVLILAGCSLLVWRPGPASPLLFGFTSGFAQRTDGYEAWRQQYALPPLRYNELNPGLLYDALRAGEVDAICGFTTDGRIDALRLRVLADDHGFFPHYDAALLARAQLFERIPALGPLLNKLTGAISTETMRKLNRRVDQDGLTPEAVAAEFLRGWAHGAGIDWKEQRAISKSADLDTPDLVIGALNSTEQYILGHILEELIDGATPWNAQLKAGLGGTAICFKALQQGDIDLCPEYSGSLAVNVLGVGAGGGAMDQLRDAGQLNAWLEGELSRRYHIEWIAPFGYSRSFAIIVRSDDRRFRGITTISGLRPMVFGGR
jgi:osmoprotectant transport system permease protein